MGRADYYSKGSWNALCDECGQKFKSFDLKKRWDGLFVCSRDWEPRQPQDFVRGIADPQAVPWSRPPGSMVFKPIIQAFLYDITVPAQTPDIILDTNNRPISQVL